MSAEERVANALHASEPVPALRTLVQDLARERNTNAEIYGLLERFLVQLRARPDFRDADEEVVLDVLDGLSGWCHPSVELLPKSRVE